MSIVLRGMDGFLTKLTVLRWASILIRLYVAYVTVIPNQTITFFFPGVFFFLDLTLIASSPNTGNKLKLLGAVCYTLIWEIWKVRNSRFFIMKFCSPLKTMDDFQLISYNWIKHQTNRSNLNWLDWCNNMFLLFPCNCFLISSC